MLDSNHVRFTPRGTAILIVIVLPKLVSSTEHILLWTSEQIVISHVKLEVLVLRWRSSWVFLLGV